MERADRLLVVLEDADEGEASLGLGRDRLLRPIARAFPVQSWRAGSALDDTCAATLKPLRIRSYSVTMGRAKKKEATKRVFQRRRRRPPPPKGNK